MVLLHDCVNALLYYCLIVNWYYQKGDLSMKLPTIKVNGVVPFKERASYWSYGAGMLVFYQLVASFLNSFIIMQGVNPLKVAGIILAVKIWDAVNDPLFAFVFDRVKFKKEKCLPWLRIAAALMPFATIAFFNMPRNWDENAKLVWFAVTYILWDFCFTINDIPFYAMSTTMTVDTKERDTIYGIARVMNGGGYFLAQIGMTWLISESVGISYGKAAIIICCIGLPFIVPLCFLGKERYAVTEKSKQEEKYTLKQMWTFLKGNKYLTIMYACQILSGLLSTSGAAGLAGTYYLYGGTTWTVLATVLTAASGPILGLLVPQWLKKFDRFHIYVYALILSFSINIIHLIGVPLGFATPMKGYITSILSSLPGTVAGILAYSFTLDTLEYGRYKTGVDGVGINFAIQTLSTKFPSSIGASLGVFLLGFTGWQSVNAESIEQLASMQVVQTREALMNMHFAGTVPILISGAASIILLLCFYKLRTKDVAIMARYNAGEITREECDAQLSRKY